MISVVITTISQGGLDVLFNGLGNQCGAPPFEVILVDEWYEERKDLVRERLREQRFDYYKHVPPDKHQGFRDDANGWNTGLRRAEGELICFLEDYTWVYPSYLRDHWACYKTRPGHSLVGALDRYPWPAMNTSKEAKDIYWSQFSRPFYGNGARDYFSMVEPLYRERRGGGGEPVPGTPYQRLSGEYFYLSLNDSIPRAVLKVLNGVDERYDGGYGSLDVDLGQRAERAGWKFLYDSTSLNCKIGMAGIPRLAHSIIKPTLRSPEDNQARCRERLAAIARGDEPVAVPKEVGAW